MKPTFVVEAQFYSGGKLIRRMATPDLYDQETAEKRAHMLTGAHGPRTAYVARLATEEELLRCQEVEEARAASTLTWRKVG
jgi:hypothetical protein